MNVLLTGATGLIGRHLRKALVARGDQVVAHARRPQKPVPGVRWIYGSAALADTFAAAIEECEAVVNLAGTPIARLWTRANRASIMASRVQTTRALGAALRAVAGPARTWINASAVGFYGQCALPCEETSGRGSGFLSDVCVAWEDAANAAVRDEDRLVLLRLGVVLAADGGMLPNMVKATRAFVGGPIGDGQQWLSWVHIQDVVRMVLWAIDEPGVRGPLNVTAPNAAHQRELMVRLAALLHRPAALRLPAAPVRWLLGQMGDELILGGQNVVCRRALAGGYAHAYPHLEVALKSLLAS